MITSIVVSIDAARHAIELASCRARGGAVGHAIAHGDPARDVRARFMLI